MSTREVADFIGLSPRTLDRYRVFANCIEILSHRSRKSRPDFRLVLPQPGQRSLRQLAGRMIQGFCQGVSQFRHRRLAAAASAAASVAIPLVAAALLHSRRVSSASIRFRNDLPFTWNAIPDKIIDAEKRRRLALVSLPHNRPSGETP